MGSLPRNTPGHHGRGCFRCRVCRLPFVVDVNPMGVRIVSEPERSDFYAGWLETPDRRLVVVRALKDDSVEIRAFDQGDDVEVLAREVFTKDNAGRLANILRRIHPDDSDQDVWYLAGAFLRPADVSKLVDALDTAVAHH